jgi:hypothetical protein
VTTFSGTACFNGTATFSWPIDWRKTITLFLCGKKHPDIGQIFTVEGEQFQCTSVSELRWDEEFQSYGHDVEGVLFR